MYFLCDYIPSSYVTRQERVCVRWCGECAATVASPPICARIAKMTLNVCLMLVFFFYKCARIRQRSFHRVFGFICILSKHIRTHI